MYELIEGFFAYTAQQGTEQISYTNSPLQPGQEQHHVPPATGSTELEDVGPGDPACLQQEGKSLIEP